MAALNAARLRHPQVGDGSALWRLVQTSGGLDLNSCYAYLLLSTHFAEHCLVAEQDGAIIGLVAAYQPPSSPDAVFVWQIGVALGSRGSGLARRMLDALIELPAHRSTRYLEATVTQSNVPAHRLFAGLARDHGVPIERKPWFDASLFTFEEHESEDHYRIGPFPR